MRAIDALADGRGVSPRALRRGGLPGWRLQKALRHMEAHYGGDLALEALAAEVALSRCHFCTAFRQTTGFTPGEWLTALRLRRARQLIRSTPLRITEIALAVGYQTPSAFTHAFRRVFRETPSRFRLATNAGDHPKTLCD
ncbi:helix-turn-helix transcriptional regulator [Caulobacter endophyticus]|uniref:helix-turn-helix transcriptional regulator n=1 Tax=Caulobacter endophyticus TaxID=2172652 RepID=UPI0024104CC6|nr:AraC family transcriptional regulator [Caulobacter endophyticus]MDG2527907.1 AraC family transcriptional regulator [Caulobacter endophyticus]